MTFSQKYISRAFIEQVTNSAIVGYFSTFIIIFSIFGDELRRIFLRTQSDDIIDIIIGSIMLIFLIEIVYKLVTLQMSYFKSIEFVLDIAATGSIVLDIAAFNETYLAPYEK